MDRALQPLGVVLKGGFWYVVAGVNGQPRTYRASSIQDMELLDESFDRPPGFDLADFWRSSSERFLEDLYRERATVRLSPRGLHLIGVLGAPAVRAAREADAVPGADGWTQIVLPVESFEHAAIDLLRLGAEVEVVAPGELRDRMAEIASAMVQLYNPQRLGPS